LEVTLQGGKGDVNFMRRLLYDLEARLLLASVCACVWGAVQLIRPVSVPNWVGVFAVVTMGEILAFWCSERGPHAVARFWVISVCLGTQSVAILSGTGHFVPFVIGAVVSVSYALSALGKLQEMKRENTSSVSSPKEDSASHVVSDETTPGKLPMVPIRDMIIVPGMTTPFVIGRGSSLRALGYALANDQRIFLATQHDASNDDPKIKEISQFGCVCNVLQHIKMPNGRVKVLVEGIEMAKTIELSEAGGFFVATLNPVSTSVRAA
jgi:hypothetical protein